MLDCTVCYTTFRSFSLKGKTFAVGECVYLLPEAFKFKSVLLL